MTQTRRSRPRLEPPEYYRQIFELNLAGVYRTTLDGTILECNRSMAKMFGYASPRELLSRQASDLYFGTAARRIFLARLRKKKVLRNCELRLRRKDGTPLDILENVCLVPDDRGRLTIIQGTMVDITVLKRFEASLRESEERHRLLAESLRRLTHHVQTVREEERARIARELHDELGQSLTALKLDLHWLQGRIGDGTPEGRIRIESMCSLVEATLQAIKGICADLRPAILDDFGLIAAIEWQAKQFESRTGIRCRTSIHPAKARIPGAQATAVFRILQESLTNIARHARASAAEISLNVSAKSLLLKVADNGIGIREKRLEGLHSLGLAGMRERALGWGGTIAVATGARRGTTVTLKMRIGQETSDEDGDGMMELPEARRSLRPGSLCTDKPKGRQGRVRPDSRRVERIASGRTRQEQHQ